MTAYPRLVEHLRRGYDEQRRQYGEAPLTDIQFANTLIAMRYLSVAEWFLEQLAEDV